jgi:hypothetical protein
MQKILDRIGSDVNWSLLIYAVVGVLLLIIVIRLGHLSIGEGISTIVREFGKISVKKPTRAGLNATFLIIAGGLLALYFLSPLKEIIEFRNAIEAARDQESTGGLFVFALFGFLLFGWLCALSVSKN